MKFGVREICDVVLRAKTKMQVGSKTFYKNEPVLYFDTLTTSSLEGSATSVYAQGGRGNTRLMAWEGERTLTFNMTDALISPESFSVLSGASIYDSADAADTSNGKKEVFVHTTTRSKVVQVDASSAAGAEWPDSVFSALDDKWVVKVPGYVCWNHRASMAGTDTDPTKNDPLQPISKKYDNTGADIFIMQLKDGAISEEPEIPDEALQGGPYSIYHYLDDNGEKFSFIQCKAMQQNSTVLVDYYVKKAASAAKQIEITPDKFGGYFYLEASTLFRDEATGKDMPAEFIIPNCKIQSNFTFTMSSTGDPSTFDFVLDAFPDYTKFDTLNKVLAVIQIVEEEDSETAAEEQRPHSTATLNPAADAENPEHKSFYVYGKATTTLAYAEDWDSIATEGRHPQTGD